MLDEHMGQKECNQIDNDDILNYILILKDVNSELSNASINKHIVAFKTIFKYAIRRELKFRKLKERNYKEDIQLLSKKHEE